MDLILDTVYQVTGTAVLRFFRSMTNRTNELPFLLEDVRRRQQALSSCPDERLSDRMDEIRDRRLDGADESTLTVDAFALVREATRRSLGIEHRANQLNAAWHLLTRKVVELPTGEGKTISAVPSLALRALAGQGVWLATANDYLARRDAMATRAVFELIGLSVGYVQSHHSPEERRLAYACDVTYGTIREFGFDFLRDRLSLGRHRLSFDETRLIQRNRFSIIVDEADSILLDDARTPLIISEPRTTSLNATVFQWSVSTGRRLVQGVDFLVDPASTHVWLTEEGRARIRDEATYAILSCISFPETYESVVRAIEAEKAFHLNRDYVVRDGKIVVVDRLTGRLAEGRQWQNGIQQSLEAANRLELTPDTTPVAKVTIQGFLQGFEHLAGMTGTAQEAAAELRATYGLRNVVIAPFRPCLRTERPFEIYQNHSEKWIAVTQAVQDLQRQRRPVLIATRDLNSSAELSDHLHRAQITHQVLTANQEADEAELISHAGEAGTVTVSTSIAGRGTDIRLGPGVVEAGGMHVLAADLFDSSRIDRQVAGRAGRQGDPATYQRILSLDDGLLHAAWDSAAYQKKSRRVISQGPSAKLALFLAAQQHLEHQHTLARHDLLVRERERIQHNQELGIDPYLDDLQS